MTLTLADVTRIARAIAGEEDAGLQTVSVASNYADTGRVELLVTVNGWHAEPYTFLMNLSRERQTVCEEEMRSEFRAARTRYQS